MRTISPIEMRAIDANAQYLGIDPIALMENAGRQVAWEITGRLEPAKAAILCGPGNNGGDGFVLSRHLRNAGWRPSVIYTHQPSGRQSSANFKILQEMDLDIRLLKDSSQARDPDFVEWLGKHEVLVDALLGTGARGSPREPLASLVNASNGTGAYRVSVDVPTGMDADTGRCQGTVFKADLTVTFHLAKTGHMVGRDLVGELVVADIGIPSEAEDHAGPGDLLFVRDDRAGSSHKGENGTLLIVGGSRAYHGAPALCGISAMRTGIDLVHLVVPESIMEVEAKHSPSLILRTYADDHLSPEHVPMILELGDRADALCIGPGLGTEESTLEAVRQLLEATRAKPVVIDADALKAVSGETESLGESAVITPHGGEFKAITGEGLPDDLDDRKALVSDYASKTMCVWAVKGENDIVAQGGIMKVNRTGTACMTVGGTGDCLTGITGAFLARGHAPFRSATAACFILGVAGQLATRDRGCHLLPTDVADKIPDAFKTMG